MVAQQLGRHSHLVRPHCQQNGGGAPWGGYDVEKMRTAGLCQNDFVGLFHSASDNIRMQHVFQSDKPTSSRTAATSTTPDKNEVFSFQKKESACEV